MSSSCFTRVKRALKILNCTLDLDPSESSTGMGDFRTMSAGRCTFIVEFGQLTVQCPCSHGSFDIPNNLANFDVQCKLCGHALAQHQHASASQMQAPTTQANYLLPAPDISEDRSRRQITVEALWKRLQTVPVVHVRGTPASGKPTLALLLQYYVPKVAPSVEVFRITWPLEIHEHYTPCERLLNSVTMKNYDFSRWLGRGGSRILIIIDEAQASYPYMSLWNDLIKFLTPGANCRVVLFSSYGSPTMHQYEAMTQTPVLFNRDQRVSLRRTPENPDIGLLFSPEEFDDVVMRTCNIHGKHGQLFSISDDLKNYLYELASGQPAVVRSLLDGLALSNELRPFRKDSAQISLGAARNPLADDDFMIKCFKGHAFYGFVRGLPDIVFHQRNPSVANFLRNMVVAKQTSDSSADNANLNICYRRGWLQADLFESECPVYSFATPLHCRYLERLLAIDTPPFPTHRFTTVEDFCFAVISRIRPSGLRTNQAADRTPLETSYQDEFYRSSFTLLSDQLHLSSEWSGTKKGGRVDFRVRGMPWAVELLRDGIGIEEHLARFNPGGNYYPWLQAQEIREYLVLDFRLSEPRIVHSNDHLYHVVFSPDFTTYRIYNSRLDLIRGVTTLLNN